MEYTCEWCMCTVCDSEHMVRLMQSTCGSTVCYECVLEWVSEPMLSVEVATHFNY